MAETIVKQVKKPRKTKVVKPVEEEIVIDTIIPLSVDEKRKFIFDKIRKDLGIKKLTGKSMCSDVMCADCPFFKNGMCIVDRHDVVYEVYEKMTAVETKKHTIKEVK